jgi:hypothetical protein
MRLWINAFIPANIPGLSRPVPGPGPTQFTMIDGPPGLGCFLTDQRGFSSDPKASARIHASVDFGDGLEGRPERAVGTTHQVDCGTGRSIASKTASIGGIVVEEEHPLEHICLITIRASVANPIVPGSPDIDFLVHFSVGFAVPHRAVRVNGHVEPFPAFEAYVLDGMRIHTLFTRSPDPGATPLDLYGPASRSVNGRVKLDV